MIRKFTSDLRRNITKLLCLTVGMAIGLLLIAKVYFVSTYDTFHDDAERLYLITGSIVRNGEYKEYEQIPGGTAPTLKKYVPQVESATRITSFVNSSPVTMSDGTIHSSEGVYFADSCFFDVIHREIIEGGNPSEILSVTDQCIIPRSLAERIGGNVIGERISITELTSDYKMTIAGVYEDFPENSIFRNYIYLSMKSLPKFFYDGTENLLGNDRYVGFLKLAKGATPDDCRPAMDKMINENIDQEVIDEFHFNVGMKPLMSIYTQRDGVKTGIWLLTVLAAIILIASSVNYLLIVTGQISSRSREMAVRKCFGTSDRKIFALVITESFIYVVAAALLGMILVFCCSDICIELLGYSPKVLYSTGYVWSIELLIIVVLLIITGVIPAYIYCRTPIANAFRLNVRQRKNWKIAMLAIEFFATGFLLCFLVLIERQYNMVTNLDLGFDYENIAFVNLRGLEQSKRNSIISEIKKLNYVENAATSFYNYIEGAPGDNIWTDGRELDQVNIADMYEANPDIFKTMGMEFVQGGPFPESADSIICQIVVEERMIDILQDIFDIEDPNIVGQSINITGHESLTHTICGVIKNMRRGGFEEESADRRAGVIFPSNIRLDNLFIRLNSMSPENLNGIQDILHKMVPEREIFVVPYKHSVESMFIDIKRTGKAVMVVGLAILLIAILGLIGYTTDEVQQRSKEIAIRKVTGTSDISILKLFCMDILRISIPALILGGISAYFVGDYWISKFTDQVSLSPLAFVLSILVILMIIVAVVCLNSLSVARSNPIIYLRNE